jgi:hypothetical protein
MKKFFLFALLLSTFVLCRAKDTTPPLKPASAVTITRTHLLIDDKAVALGQPMSDWKKILPGTPRCYFIAKMINLCVWDEFGLRVQEYRSTVYLFALYLVIPKVEEELDEFSEPPSVKDKLPAHPYTGRLELDGYPISPQSTFAQVSGHIDPDRVLSCTKRDNCLTGSGNHFDGRARLGLEFNLSGSQGQLRIVRLIAEMDAYSGLPAPSECIADSFEAMFTGCTPLIPAAPDPEWKHQRH